MHTLAIVLLLSMVISVPLAEAAWSGPPGTPPNNNVAAPINVGGTFQDKTGSVWFDGGAGVNGGATGKMCVGAWCIKSWADIGTTTAVSSQWVTGAGGLIYYNGGNVGIGTVGPVVKLDIFGNAGGTWNTAVRLRDGGSSGSWRVNACDGTGDGNCPGNGLVIHQDGVATRMAFTNSGNVGIGTINPAYKLQVGDAAVVGSDGQIAIGKNGGGTRTAVLKFDSGFNFGIFDMGTNRQFSVAWNAPVDSMYINSTGNVGIGTASPRGLLDISIPTNNVDGFVFYQPIDNSLALQSYIDNQWANRNNYAPWCGSGGCNILKIQPDGGIVYIGGDTHLVANGSGGMAGTGSLYADGKVTAPQYCIGASCITAWPSGIGGSGTAGRIPRFVTATTLGDSSITSDGVSATAVGNFFFGNVGANFLSNGTGDGASYTTYNFALNGWFGMALKDYSGTVHGVYNFRTGDWTTDGLATFRGTGNNYFAGNIGIGTAVPTEK